jgi:DNA modification methylase
VTPEAGPVVDGTCGSGGTLIAAQIEGRDSEGCDIDPGCVAIAEARLRFWTPERHRQVLADAEALKAHERAVAREKAVPQHDDLPLFRGAQ